MIEPSELRIGSWVRYKSFECQWDIEYFSELKYNTGNIIQPIEITDGYLIKNGFKYVEEFRFYADMDHIIYEVHECWCFQPFCTNDIDCWVKIKYVHHLQNILHALISGLK